MSPGSFVSYTGGKLEWAESDVYTSQLYPSDLPNNAYFGTVMQHICRICKRRRIMI